LDASNVCMPSVTRDVSPFVEITCSTVPGGRPVTPECVLTGNRSVKKTRSDADADADVDGDVDCER
jgi:hypothetical protein